MDLFFVTDAPTGELALTGPSKTLDAAHWPVRGDLAHIRLAGLCFVPHYAVPMAHRLTAPATLRAAQGDHSPERAALTAGTLFNVLDIAGNWAWGQVGEDGFVGYLPLSVLERA